MRRRLSVLVGATVSLVLVAFLVPLALLTRTVAEDRAVSSAFAEAQTLSVLAATADTETLTAAIERANVQGEFPVTVVDTSGAEIGAPAPATDALNLALSGRTLSARTPDGGVEVLVSVQDADGTTVTRAYITEEQLHAGVVRSWLILLLVGTGLLLISLVVAHRMARSLVSSIDELAATSERLADGDLQARARSTGPAEISAVAGTLNTLADRIRDLLARERERVADLSHRVRTPLTALRLEAESLNEPGDRHRVEASVAALEQAVTDSINAARNPGRESVGGAESASCDAARVVAERVEFWGVLAEDQQRTYSTDLAAVPLWVSVAEDDLSSAVDALLGNVFSHTPEGTGFGVRLEAATAPESGGTLVVWDEGPGLEETALQRGHSGGDSTGLGLDIVRRCAEESGGRMTVDSSGGARITLRLGGPFAQT